MGNAGRPHLPLGTYGEISVREVTLRGGKPCYVATARFRDMDGVTRPVTKRAQTKTKARELLRVALRDRQHEVEKSAIGSSTTVADLAEQWQAQGSTTWATNTVERYALAASHVVAEMGSVQMRELARPGINTALTRIAAAHGTSSATSAKTALNGMCKLALQYDALPSNPVRDAISIRGPRRDKPRALTVSEVNDLIANLRADDDASLERYDLADLVEWMLATGARIGEACATRDASLDRDANVWEVNATLVRVRGKGMVIQPRPKTAAGWRRLALPPFAAAMLRRRESSERLWSPDRVAFPSPGNRRLRDPSNTAADLRLLLDRYGYDWVTSHTFRRTVATRMDEAGVSARQIADQLGHAKPSMTQDFYMGREVVSSLAAEILERPASTGGTESQPLTSRP